MRCLLVRRKTTPRSEWLSLKNKQHVTLYTAHLGSLKTVQDGHIRRCDLLEACLPSQRMVDSHWIHWPGKKIDGTLTNPWRSIGKSPFTQAVLSSSQNKQCCVDDTSTVYSLRTSVLQRLCVSCKMFYYAASDHKHRHVLIWNLNKPTVYSKHVVPFKQATTTNAADRRALRVAISEL